jgi:hypothetical protein
MGIVGPGGGGEGKEGKEGKPGPEGPPGPEGKEGKEGKEGPKGATGEKGEKGEKGTTGEAGPAGKLTVANPTEKVERAKNIEFEPSATKDAFVYLEFKVKAPTEVTTVTITVAGIVLASYAVSPKIIGDTWVCGFIIAAGKKWKFEVAPEGNFESAFSNYIFLD